MIRKQEVRIPALDGFMLSAFVLTPENGIRGVVQFHSAIAVRKEFYLKFCEFLAGQGFAVVVHDNRGIGGSRPARLKNFTAFLREWGEMDMPGVLNWIAETYPRVPKFIIAHSMGAQIIGLMNNLALLNGIYTISNSVGYWRTVRAPFRYFCAFLWYVLVPLATLLSGYAPCKRLGMGEDLPAGVAREWAAWSRNKGYISAFFGKTIAGNYYGDVTVPVNALFMEDDPIANPASVRRMLEYYTNAATGMEMIPLKELNAGRAGHNGFFSSRYKDILWQKPIDWMDAILRIS